MHLTLRTKLLTIAGAAGAAFVVLIATQTFLARQMNHQISTIQNQFIPLIELGPRLESQFDHLRRSFQDSVAAQDTEALEKTGALRAELLKDLSSTQTVVDASRLVSLRQAIEDYGDAAYGVSRRLIKGETGIALIDLISQMQVKQARTEKLLKEAFAVDRTRLVEAFSSIKKTQDTSGRTLLAISVLCLLIVSLLSTIISRGILRALSELSSGLNRFGQGKFGEPIVVSSRDELEDVAQEANRMASRTASLLKELESFSYSVAHDLRAPLRGILGFGKIIIEDYSDKLPAEAKELLQRVVKSAKKMGQLVDSLLSLSRLARTEIKKEPINLSGLAADILTDLKVAQPKRQVEFRIQEALHAQGDLSLLRIVLTNLLGNAWKFTSKNPAARIELGAEDRKDERVFFVRDNGAGFDMQYEQKLFGTFQRLHSEEEFEGTGIGLATVQTIILRHGGRIWAEGKVDEGAVFFFTLGKGL